EQAVVDAQSERVSEAGGVHARATWSMNGKSVGEPSERPQSAARRPHCGPGARAGEAVRANSQTCSHTIAPRSRRRAGSLPWLRRGTLTVLEATRVLPRNRGRRRSLSGTIHASRERWLPGTGTPQQCRDRSTTDLVRSEDHVRQDKSPEGDRDRAALQLGRSGG